MHVIDRSCIATGETKATFAVAVLALVSAVLCTTTVAANVAGQVLGGGAPIANSTVTLFAASTGNPQELAQTQTDTDGRFSMAVPDTGSKVSGENSSIALMTVLGAKRPGAVTINEMTTVASVWTHAQFLDGTAIMGHALGLKIAAGNVPSFVDLQTGGWGATIQDSLNGGQTPTMANF